MTKTKTAWLALSLLACVSVVAAMTAGVSHAPVTTDTTTEQTAAVVQPASEAPLKPADDPEPKVVTELDEASARPADAVDTAARDVVDPDPAPVLRGAELPTETPPSAPAPIVNVTSRQRREAATAAKTAAPAVQSAKAPKDSKAEMRAKRSKTAANPKTCASANGFTGLLQKLNLAPRCTT
jgi:hypothetical protein